MQPNMEGFLAPVIAQDDCIQCGLCDKTCPLNKQLKASSVVNAYACHSNDEENRLNSSSGGLFFHLGLYVLGLNGVVFGARFDKDWNVCMDYTEDIEGLKSFRGSKYVQADTKQSYQQVKSFLKDGRFVLYSGTPCQIAGLKSYLRKQYDNLICVDFICHGVPSPLIWKKYLYEMTHDKMRIQKSEDITNIEFRNKSHGWKKIFFSIYYRTLSGSIKQYLKYAFRDDYMRLFLFDFSLRESCYDCQFKEGKSGSDLTIADFWSIENVFPEMDDNRGISSIIVHTAKGNECFDAISGDITYKKVDIEIIKRYNAAYTKSAKMPEGRYDMFSEVHALSIKQLSFKYTYNKIGRIKRLIRNLIEK